MKRLETTAIVFLLSVLILNYNVLADTEFTPEFTLNNENSSGSNDPVIDEMDHTGYDKTTESYRTSDTGVFSKQG